MQRDSLHALDLEVQVVVDAFDLSELAHQLIDPLLAKHLCISLHPLLLGGVDVTSCLFGNSFQLHKPFLPLLQFHFHLSYNVLVLIFFAFQLGLLLVDHLCVVTFLRLHVTAPGLPCQLDAELADLADQLVDLLVQARILHFQRFSRNLVVSILCRHRRQLLLLLDGLCVVEVKLVFISLLLKVDLVVVSEGLCRQHLVQCAWLSRGNMLGSRQ